MRSRRSLILGLAGATVLLCGNYPRVRGVRGGRPPRMLLRAANGHVQRGKRGSFCWEAGCIDTGHVAPECPLVVAAGEALSLHTHVLGSLSYLAYEIWRYVERSPTDAVRISMDPRRNAVLDFPVDPVPLPSDIPPGLYVVDAFAEALRGGSSYQAFKLLVEPLHPAATPASAPATPTPVPGCAEKA